jgi:hypothetical protein
MPTHNPVWSASVSACSVVGWLDGNCGGVGSGGREALMLNRGSTLTVIFETLPRRWIGDDHERNVHDISYETRYGESST